ncbi:hypothetical protein AN958_08533 [Leucoagaricus sp. SymC.cos]|nr:hypothetical protein AN958_08533 [Leucoagaricus sp. SymC.cos]
MHYIDGRDSRRFNIKKTSTKRPQATLQLLSRAPLPGSTKTTPRFIGGDALQGSVILRCHTPVNIHSIKLTLKGNARTRDAVAYSPVNEHTFLDCSYLLYSRKTSGNPRWNGQCNTSRNKESDGTLHGSYSFPYYFPFPTSSEWKPLPTENTSKAGPASPVLSYSPPPSFSENGSSWSVSYKLGMVVTHGALRSKSKTTTEIIYLPRRVSPPASERRQAAYREGALIPGPCVDPNGWYTFCPWQSPYVARSLRFHFDQLSSPSVQLSYTRGTVIPCYMKLSSPDISFLNALASPRAVNLALFRTISHSQMGQGISSIDKSAPLVSAVWWSPPKTEFPLDAGKRHLEGEVHLSKTMVSSCDFPLFNIEYTLALLPFTIPSFKSTLDLSSDHASHPEYDNRDHRQLLKCTVEITTFHEYGPIPVSFTSPASGNGSVRKEKKEGYGEDIPLWAQETKTASTLPSVSHGWT